VRNDGYRVHAFAELAGVTVKTLHHYDRVGLLRPRRTPAGYRLYMSSDLVRLEQILALKTIGFSLHEIGNCSIATPFRCRRSSVSSVKCSKRNDGFSIALSVH
jgi:DNA-binding transcriptional MerR regulator